MQWPSNCCLFFIFILKNLLKQYSYSEEKETDERICIATKNVLHSPKWKKKRKKKTYTQLFVYALNCTCSDSNFHRTDDFLGLFHTILQKKIVDAVFTINCFCFVGLAHSFGSVDWISIVWDARERHAPFTPPPPIHRHLQYIESQKNTREENRTRRAKHREKSLGVCFRLSLLKLGLGDD